MITLLLITVLTASGSAPAWLTQVGDPAGITSVRATASVTVSDGLTYDAITLYEGPDQARFTRVYEDRTVAHRVDGEKVWQIEGDTETEVGAFYGMFVMGHQIHAQILFFDQIHPDASEPVPARFDGQDCFAVAAGGEFSWRLYYPEDGLPLGMGLPREEGSPIVYVFEDWREVDGVQLPHAVFIDDGERQFDYRFTEVEIQRF